MNRFDKSSNHKLGQESIYNVKKNPYLIWNEHTIKPIYNKLPTVIEEKSIDISTIYKNDEKFVDELKNRLASNIDKFLKQKIKLLIFMFSTNCYIFVFIIIC